MKREDSGFCLGLHQEQTSRDELGGELGSSNLEEGRFPGEEVGPGVGEDIRGDREGGGGVLGQGHGWEGKNAHGRPSGVREGKEREGCQSLIISVEKS
jgi:hypothetical protein